jgi:uncharacterized HAD superfamily protein
LSTEGKTHNTFTKSLKITTVVIRIWNWMENRQYIYQKIEETTGIIRICNWRENRQYICQMLEETTGVCSPFSFRF